MISANKSEFAWGEKTFVMGIINLSPDSFSGDGLSVPEAVMLKMEQMLEAPVDLIDIGAQSTRPGHEEITISEEIRRLDLVLSLVRSQTDLPISLATYRSELVTYGLNNGVNIINDIWGLKMDPNIAAIVADRKASIILMHNQNGTCYENLVDDIKSSLFESVTLALDNGIGRDSIILDPGIGFGKTPRQNLEVIRRLSEIKSLGLPILVGASRKSVIGYTLDLPVEKRLEGTAAINAIAINNGADMIRVHDVVEMSRVAKMSDAIVRFRPD